MGLDQYVFRVKKAELEDREYTTNELSGLDVNYVSAKNVEENEEFYAQILPYAIKRDVSYLTYDVDNMISDYNLPSNSRIWMSCYDRIEFCGTDENGERVTKVITREEIEEKYTLVETEPHYIWDQKEIAYWRKNYDLQDWVYDALDNVDNTKYCILNKDTIREINRAFGEHLPLREPTKRSALFYWEWY